MKKLTIAAVLVAAVSLSACTAPNQAKRILEAQGYTNVETGGYGLFKCGQDDAFATNFTATSPSGTTVSGTVCSGWFKGSTIRF